MALLHWHLPACSSPLHVLSISDAHFSPPYFKPSPVQCCFQAHWGWCWLQVKVDNLCLALSNLSLSWLHKSQTEVLEFYGTELFLCFHFLPSLSRTLLQIWLLLVWTQVLPAAPSCPKFSHHIIKTQQPLLQPAPSGWGLCTQEVSAAFKVLLLTLNKRLLDQA